MKRSVLQRSLFVILEDTNIVVFNKESCYSNRKIM